MSQEPKIIKFAKRVVIALFLVTFLVNFFVMSQVSAETIINLSITRDLGYALGSDINGQFTANAQVSSDVVHVEFYINGTLQYNDTAAPFSWTFDTNNYALGNYNITAIAYDSSGQQASAVLNENFVDSSAGNTALIIILPISIIVIVTSIFYKFRKNSKLTKCPNCGYVFPRRYSWIHFGNIGRNKCPNCGKDFWTRAYKGPPPNDDEKSAPSGNISDDERLRKDIENSKYDN